MIDFKSIQLELSSVCNCNCIICPYTGSWQEKSLGFMSEWLLDKILRDIKKEDSQFDGVISPYLCSEPFMDPKCMTRIEKIYKMFPNCVMEIATNAELLTDEDIYKLVLLLATHRGKLTITHHGTNRDEVMKYMKGIDYDKTIKNIIKLVKMANNAFPITFISLSHSIDDKVRLIQPRQIQKYWGDIFDQNNLTFGDNIKVQALQFNNMAGNTNIDGWNYNRKIRDIDETHPFKCFRIEKGNIHICYNGDVLLCPIDYKHEIVIGNLNKQSISEIYESDRYKEVLDMIDGRKESSDDFICKRCLNGG